PRTRTPPGASTVPSSAHTPRIRDSSWLLKASKACSVSCLASIVSPFLLGRRGRRHEAELGQQLDLVVVEVLLGDLPVREAELDHEGKGEAPLRRLERPEHA